MKKSESFRILTPRLLLTPVSKEDFEDLAKFKADPQSFSHMLGGVRTFDQTKRELEKDLNFWHENGLGMFTLRLQSADLSKPAPFVGISGVHQRPDWSGFALRFAISPDFRGKGMGKEALSSTLDFVFKAGLSSIIALAREDNLPSRHILSSIGMLPCGIFIRKQIPMWIYEAKAPLDISSKT